MRIKSPCKRQIMALALASSALVGILTGCREQKSEVQPGAPEEPVVAIINGREVSRAAFESYLQIRALNPEARDHTSTRDIFDEFVIEQLLVQAATREKIELSDEEFHQYLEEWQKTGEVPKDTLNLLRDYVRAQKLVRQKISEQVQVGEEEMESYYAEHKVDFLVDDQVHVLEILVSSEDEAISLRGKLRLRDFRGFRQLARQKSKGQTADDGGDLGMFERGQLPEEFERVIFGLKPGGVSQVFRSEHGYHIFMLEEFIPRHPQEFHEAQGKILENLLAAREREATEKYLTQIRKQASVEVLDPNLDQNWR